MPKIFSMIRNNDENGISGTGKVLSGCIFDSGKTVVEWNSKSNINSINIYDTYYDFYWIHCKSHPTNNTEMVFETEFGVHAVSSGECGFCGNLFNEHPKDNEDSKYVRSCSGNLVTIINFNND